MPLRWWQQKKLYTRLAAALVFLSAFFAIYGLVSFQWFRVRGAPAERSRHTLRGYGLLGACYRSDYGSDERPVIENYCHAINPFDCNVFIQRIDHGSNPGGDPVPFHPVPSCDVWNAAVALYMNAILFFVLSSFLTFLTGFVISPSLSLGAATSLFIATGSTLITWAIVTRTRDFDVENVPVEVVSSTAYALVTTTWVFGAVSLGIELYAALKGRRRSYSAAYVAYSDDDAGSRDASPTSAAQAD